MSLVAAPANWDRGSRSRHPCLKHGFQVPTHQVVLTDRRVLAQPPFCPRSDRRLQLTSVRCMACPALAARSGAAPEHYVAPLPPVSSTQLHRFLINFPPHSPEPFQSSSASCFPSTPKQSNLPSPQCRPASSKSSKASFSCQSILFLPPTSILSSIPLATSPVCARLPHRPTGTLRLSTVHFAAYPGRGGRFFFFFFFFFATRRMIDPRHRCQSRIVAPTLATRRSLAS